ncbi:MAG TPA: hypothetical protein VNG13_10070 [Mycobacteriales bacterium]|nr:hypothetical protein [Mycobacteriales bacterium]
MPGAASAPRPHRGRRTGHAERVIRYACAQRLAAAKVPKLVEFRDSLPRTTVGKPLRRVLLDEGRRRTGPPAARPRARTARSQ